MIQTKKTIIITGASSGIGEAIAKQYASAGVRLFLFGRSKERLEMVADYCRSKKAEAHIVIIDVTNADLMREEIEKICSKYGLDIIIANAGVSAGTLGKPESQEQISDIFATNVQGVANSVIPALPFLIEQKHGQIVLISSMAAMLGLSSAPSYSASKAAVKIFGDGMRAYLKQFNVKVNVVLPGYVDTPMTKVNKFPMPFKISANRAASIIVSGIAQNHGLIVFPKITYYFLKIVNLLPYQLIDYVNSKLPGK